jgi:hypothetical protein
MTIFTVAFQALDATPHIVAMWCGFVFAATHSRAYPIADSNCGKREGEWVNPGKTGLALAFAI